MSVESEVEKVVKEIIGKKKLISEDKLNDAVKQLTKDLLEVMDERIATEVKKHLKYLLFNAHDSLCD